MAAIGTIRNKMGGILIVVLVIAMVSFLMMDMTGSGQNRVQAQNEVATVNGESISLIEFNSRLEQNINNYKNQLQIATISDVDRNNIRQSTYDEMITEKINESKYKSMGIEVSDKEYAALLSDSEMQHPTITSSFVNEQGVFDQQRFNDYLSTLDADEPGTEPGTKRKSWNNFERYMLNERLTNKYYSLVESGINIPTWMAQAMYNQERTPVSFDYVFMPYRDITDSTVSVTDAELSSYIAENPKEYKREESVNLKFATFPIVASEADVTAANEWMNKKLTEWKTDYASKDSLFIKLYSDEAYTNTYFREDEFLNLATDTLFQTTPGTVVGPYKEGDSYTAYKLLDRKMVPDSLQARHLLLSYETMTSQEELQNAIALRDSLFDLIQSGATTLTSLTPIYSNDEANKFDGGDLGWIQPNQMVIPFNNAIFFEMEEGDVKMVNTDFGLHIVEVYNSTPSSEAIKVATLRRNIYPSEETQNNIYYTASTFSGNNRDRAAFEEASNSISVDQASNITKDKFTIQNINGNARDMVKWAFSAEEGEVSVPFSIGDAYYVAMVDKKSEKGLAKLDDVRFIVEEEVIKQKKAEMLKAKLQGSDLNAIANSAGKSVSSASSISFENPTIQGVGNEPKVVGEALGLAVNGVSKPIAGNNGVFVVKTTSKVDPPAATSLDTYKLQLSSKLTSAVTSRLASAAKESADIKDNRFDIF